MIDHNACRLVGNPSENLIIPVAFYVVELKKLAENKAFLKGSLWPYLDQLYTSRHIQHFWEHYPDSILVSNVGKMKLLEFGATSTTKECMQGEGICGM